MYNRNIYIYTYYLPILIINTCLMHPHDIPSLRFPHLPRGRMRSAKASPQKVGTGLKNQYPLVICYMLCCDQDSHHVSKQ